MARGFTFSSAMCDSCSPQVCNGRQPTDRRPVEAQNVQSCRPYQAGGWPERQSGCPYSDSLLSLPTCTLCLSRFGKFRNDRELTHTLKRKTRCDPGLPRCTPCKKTNAVCDYYDAAKGRKMSREYVLYLQKRVRDLEEELAMATDEPADPPLTVEHLLRDASFVRIKENDEGARFLGPSSGIAMIRLVMEIAKNVCKAQSITEIVPEQKAREIRKRVAQEASKPTSKVYPEISFVAAPALPSIELTERLVENFHMKGP